MRVELHPEARAELAQAAAWHDESRPSFGDELVAAASSTFGKIANAPASFGAWLGAPPTATVIRKAKVARFPYLVAFEVHPDFILVLAVAHAKRRPLYWITRATSES